MDFAKSLLLACLALTLLAECALTSPLLTREQELQHGPPPTHLRSRRDANVIATPTATDNTVEKLLLRLRRSMAQMHQGSFHYNNHHYQSSSAYRRRRHRRRHHRRRGRVHDA